MAPLGIYAHERYYLDNEYQNKQNVNTNVSTYLSRIHYNFKHENATSYHLHHM